MSDEQQDARWVSIAEAADVLGYDPVSLRRAVARHAQLAEDGTVEVSFNGIVARKVGRSWRVWLALRWRRPK